MTVENDLFHAIETLKVFNMTILRRQKDNNSVIKGTRKNVPGKRTGSINASEMFAFCVSYCLMLLDWVCRFVLGRRLSPLTEESLLRKFTAEEQKILMSDDLTRRWWYEGFIIMLKCFREDIHLSAEARLTFENRWTEILKNRLAISRELKFFYLSQCLIKRPIFIIGAARTGTIFLQRLLCKDPQNTGPKFYELMEPIGRQNTMRNHALQLETMYRKSPKCKAIHHIRPESPYECFLLFDTMGLHHDCLCYTGNCEEYLAWYNQRTKDEWLEAYRFHKLQMQLILLARGQDSINGSKRLIFKNSFHALHIEAILQVYPDALFIHTYRNPTLSTASIASFAEFSLTCNGYTPNDIDWKQLGQNVLHSWTVPKKEIVKFRRDHPEEEYRFIDIAFDDIVASPVDAVKKIYDHFDIEMSPEGEALMTSYVKDNPRYKYGRHEYDLSHYHLTKEMVLEHLQEYVREYRIEC